MTEGQDEQTAEHTLSNTHYCFDLFKDNRWEISWGIRGNLNKVIASCALTGRDSYLAPSY